MADLSDVMNYLAQAAANAVYPNGTSQPSVAAMDVRIFDGWPNPDKLDRDVAGKDDSNPPLKRANGPAAQVSIYPMQGTGVQVYQILDETYTITPPAINLSVSTSIDPTTGDSLTLTILNSAFTIVSEGALTVSTPPLTITVTGEPAVGEYITLVIDDAVVCSQTGDTTADLLAALATQAQGFGYAATSTVTTLSVPFGHTIVVRQGGVGTLGKVTHRQCQSIMVSVWAPTQVSRTKLASAIDNVIKQSIIVTMPDSSQAKVIYSRTNVTDEQTEQTIYRRDLIYDVEYATVEQFPGAVVTSTQVSVANPGNSSVIPAIT